MIFNNKQNIIIIFLLAILGLTYLTIFRLILEKENPTKNMYYYIEDGYGYQQPTSTGKRLMK